MQISAILQVQIAHWKHGQQIPDFSSKLLQKLQFKTPEESIIVVQTFLLSTWPSDRKDISGPQILSRWMEKSSLYITTSV